MKNKNDLVDGTLVKGWYQVLFSAADDDHVFLARSVWHFLKKIDLQLKY